MHRRLIGVDYYFVLVLVRLARLRLRLWQHCRLARRRVEIVLRSLGSRSLHLVDFVHVVSTQVGLDVSLLDVGHVLSGRGDHLLAAAQVLDVASTMRGLLALLLL